MAHKFGGPWTATKLAALEDYLTAYAQALKNQHFELRYIDAFAGSGTYVAQGGGSIPRRGSARIALDVDGFSHYTFIESNRKRAAQLQSLQAEYPHKQIRVSAGDANEHLLELCTKVNWRSHRAVVFLDPYGMSVDWATLERIRDTRAVDVWYLFPFNAMLRQMSIDPQRRDLSKDAALDRVLGTGCWRSELYAPPPQTVLFGEHRPVRERQLQVIRDWLTARLKATFPMVNGPAMLHMRRGPATMGPPLYALYFLVSNPAAIHVAKPISDAVISRLRREHPSG